MRYLVSASLLLVGIIHLLPVSGVLGGERLAALYGVTVADPSLALLLRHRAVLFGLLGVLLCVAAFVPALQPAAFVAGVVSVGSFLLLARMTGPVTPQVSRVVTADIVAAIALAIGIVAAVWAMWRNRGVPGS